jgi:prepilin-type N-terminal cleavage/methylation domain-containing protein
MKNNSNNLLKQKGFTLIELITVIGIIGVLAAISLTGFILYRQNAAIAVLNRLSSDTTSDVEAAFAQGDVELPAVSDYSQNEPGPISDSTARQILGAVVVPRQVTYNITVDPTCMDAGCIAANLSLYHEKSDRHVTTIRTGDGIWVSAEAD